MSKKCIDERQLQALAFNEIEMKEETNLMKHIEDCENCRQIYQGYLLLQESLISKTEKEPLLNDQVLKGMIDKAITVSNAKKSTSMPLIRWVAGIAATVLILMYGYQQYTIQLQLKDLQQRVSMLPTNPAPPSDSWLTTRTASRRIMGLLNNWERQNSDELEALMEQLASKEAEMKLIREYLDKHYPEWEKQKNNKNTSL